MKLKDYLVQMGTIQAARQLGVSERAIQSYRYGARLPKPATAIKMVRRSKGALTMLDIYSA